MDQDEEAEDIEALTELEKGEEDGSDNFGVEEEDEVSTLSHFFEFIIPGL